MGEPSVDRRNASNFHNGNGHRGGIEMTPGGPDPGEIRTMMDGICEAAVHVPDIDISPSPGNAASREAPPSHERNTGFTASSPANERLTVEPWRLLITVSPIPQEGQEPARKSIFAPCVRWETHTYAREQRRGGTGKTPGGSFHLTACAHVPCVSRAMYLCAFAPPVPVAPAACAPAPLLPCSFRGCSFPLIKVSPAHRKMEGGGFRCSILPFLAGR